MKEITCHWVDFAVLPDYRVKVKESEQIEKYLDFTWEIKKLLKMRVPEIKGSPGRIMKETDKDINKITGSINLYEIQEIALRGTGPLFKWVLCN